MARSTRQSTYAAAQRGRDRNFCLRTAFKSFDTTSTIVVGPTKTEFLVHKDVATQQSPYFAAALNGSFSEGDSQTITLEEVDAKIFEHVVLWLYAGRLEYTEFFFKDGKPTYFTLLDIYSLADRLLIEGLRNAVVDRMAELAEATNSVPTPTDTHILYDSIRENSPLRRLILDLFAFKKTDNLISTHPDSWHPTFLRDLICKLKRPGFSALMRHDIKPWSPLAWPSTKACEVCKVVLKPNVSGNVCGVCGRAFCCGCVVKGMGGGVLDWSIAERECKPWLRGMCAVGYHEHEETERCGSSNGGSPSGLTCHGR
ncbi:hypothetical protein EJ08DRAFT_665833 [Tothia fuscella]|uniref:BTB domain-containing protein n=1 Tax=Tothia fuscella TaxID=1048955 RepID=A0A9P4NFT2_9PEZI|nr:hypothetical protein EJ08DRAFT_665833 [Tothia fuscella]